MMGTDVYHTLKYILRRNHLNTGVGDEGGFAPNLESSEQALDLLVQAIEQAGYKTKEEIAIAMDCAASSESIMKMRSLSFYGRKQDGRQGSKKKF